MLTVIIYMTISIYLQTPYIVNSLNDIKWDIKWRLTNKILNYCNNLKKCFK